MNDNEQNVAVGTHEESKKKTGRKIWLFVFLLLPSLIAFISFFVIYNNLYFSSSNIYNITLYDEEGNVIDSESNFLREAQKDGLVSLFSPITEGLTEPAVVPDYISTAHKFHAVVKYMNTVNEYDFYFFSGGGEGYCSYNGNTYIIGAKDVEKFLLSRFAESVYENSDPPLMYSISGDVIVPQYVSWNYKMVQGQYRSASSYASTDEVLVYDMASALGVSFSVEPDRCKINVYKDGALVFSGTSGEISSLAVQKGEMMQVEVEAQWYYSSNESFYGLIRYNFAVNVTDQAEFYLSDDTFALDSFCGIFCKNVKDASKIEFTSEPLLPAAPRFETSGDNVIAFLPILSSTTPGEYKITLKYGAATQSFLIEIKQIEKGAVLECNANSKTVTAALSEKTADEIQALRSFVSGNSKGEKLFYGNFLDYRSEEIGAEQYSRFGDIYKNPQKQYMSRGHEYRFAKSGGVGVYALNSGKVIRTGYNDFLGNYVIVSHGCGLSTWYAHLSTIDVFEGDYVVREQVVGKTGTSGLSSTENVMIFVTLGSEFIDPQYLCGKQFD